MKTPAAVAGGGGSHGLRGTVRVDAAGRGGQRDHARGAGRRAAAGGRRGRLAADGEEALAYLRAKPLPDLVLLDMMMPVLDGWGFLVERRRDPALAAVPVVITTALTIANAEWATSLGAVGTLRKPFSTQELRAAVGAALGAGD